ncbi:hypothetical protein SDC9_187868 [bioreactor metagenome]|uniref:Uncharacterized protein n=1 Tax=bioreactor metagenome TaxID=1076179 RepID=A0A645HPE1_9ZZZZ
MGQASDSLDQRTNADSHHAAGISFNLILDRLAQGIRGLFERFAFKLHHQQDDGVPALREAQHLFLVVDQAVDVELGGNHFSIVLGGDGQLDDCNKIPMGDEIEPHIPGFLKRILRPDNTGHQVAQPAFPDQVRIGPGLLFQVLYA